MNIRMSAQVFWTTKRRMTMFPSTGILSRQKVLIHFTVKPDFMFFEIDQAVSDIFAVINRTRNILPVMNSFTMVGQTVINWHCFKTAIYTFYFDFYYRVKNCYPKFKTQSTSNGLFFTLP